MAILSALELQLKILVAWLQVSNVSCPELRRRNSQWLQVWELNHVYHRYFEFWIEKKLSVISKVGFTSMYKNDMGMFCLL